MRITVGHVLVGLGLIGAGYYSISGGRALNWVMGKAQDISSDSKSVAKMLDSNSSDGSGVQSSSSSVASEPAKEKTDLPVENLSTQDQTAAIKQEQPVSDQKIEAQTPPVVSPVMTTKRKRRRKKVVPPVEANAAPTPAPVPKLKRRSKKARVSPTQTSSDSSSGIKEGSYVSMELKSGRKIEGLLTKISDTQYTLELPGMGPFSYAISDVKSVTPSK